MFIRKHFTTESLVLEASPFNRELAMESYILDNPSVLALNLKEFNDVTILTSELTLLNAGSNKKGKTDGRIDILANYDSEYLAIVELKKGMLIRKHFEQLQNYLKEKTQILEKGKKQLGLDLWDESLSGPPKWIGVMIGESIEPELMLSIRKGLFTDDNIPIAALTINRFRNRDGHFYIVTDTYFVDKLKGKDYTKYEFDGQVYPKNRLVLAVIKKFVEDNNNIKFSELISKFPNKLQGNGVFTTQSEALKIKENDRERHFLKPEELIKIQDEIIAVSSQWGVGNLPRFLEKCKELKIKVTENKGK